MHIEDIFKLIESGKTEEGLDILKLSISTFNDEEKFEGAILLLELGHVDDALEVLDDLHQLYEDEMMITCALVQACFMAEREDDAFDYIAEVSKDHPDYADLLLIVGDYYFSLGLFEVCESKLLEAYDLNQENASVLFALGEFYAELNDTVMAIHFYKKLLLVSDEESKVTIQFKVGNLHLIQGDYEEAIAQYEEVGEEMKGNPTYHFYYGVSLFFVERYDVAMSHLEKAFEDDPTLKQAVVYIAKCKAALYDYPGAIRLLEEHQAVIEESEEALSEYVKALMNVKRYDDALPHLEKWMSIDDENIEAISFYLQILEDREDYEEIILFVNKQMSEGIELPQFYWVLAKAYEEIEEYEKALNNYDVAYTLLQDHFEFLIDYAEFLTQEGERLKALEVYHKALKLAPSDEELHERIRLLES